MRKLFVCCVSLLVTSCAATPPDLGVQARDVYVPVTEGCVKQADIPKPPQPAIPAGADVGQESEAVSAYARAAKRYIAKANDLLRGCAITN